MDFTDVHGSGLTKEGAPPARAREGQAQQAAGRYPQHEPHPVRDVRRRHHQGSPAVEEAHKLGIPVVAIVDTNADPDTAEYPIPANDDAIRGIELLTSLMADAVAEGLLERSGANKAEGEARRAADGRLGKDLTNEAPAEASAEAAAPAAAEAKPPRPWAE